MPEPFPWKSSPEQAEGYVVVDPLVLQAIKELFWIDLVDKQMQPVLRLVMRVASIDPVTGNLVIGVRLVRDLNKGEQGEHGLGTI